jgi:hypothetical protein
MKKFLVFILIISFNNSLFSQSMTPKKLKEILTSMSDSIQGTNRQWTFSIKNVGFICVTDSLHNRMRIISPIADASKLTPNIKSAALVANFHSVLDVKYAIADQVLWSAFIHPLKELTDMQVKDAIKQVYSANVTFGTSFSSINLVFPESKKEEKKKELPKKLFKEF